VHLTKTKEHNIHRIFHSHEYPCIVIIPMLFPPEEASVSTVERMLHRSVLERMPVTGVDPQGALERNDPLANSKQQPQHSNGRVGQYKVKT